MMLKELMLLSCGVLSVLGATIPAKDRINIPLTDDQLIFPDNADDCINRPKQWQRARHSYFLSTNRTMNWMQARNYCRKSCMDAISIETAEENAWVTDLINSTGLNFIWTSGVCRGERCYNTNKETTHDWMWAGSGAQMAPSAEWSGWPWGLHGHRDQPQPDNAEKSINGVLEKCVAILNKQVYKKDPLKWHDIGCYHLKGTICEDSPALLALFNITD